MLTNYKKKKMPNKFDNKKKIKNKTNLARKIMPDFIPFMFFWKICILLNNTIFQIKKLY